jgi:hypothetical protein
MKRIAPATCACTVIVWMSGCTGGSGPLPGFDDNYDSRAGYREPSGPAREVPRYNSERPGIDRDRPRPTLVDPPPGLKVGGGSGGFTQTGSFKCSGAYVCKRSDSNSTNNVTLGESGGKCRFSGFTLEPDGSLVLTADGQTQQLGTWSVSGDTLTLSSGQTTTICTPRQSSSGSSGSSSGSSGTIIIDAGG